MRRLVVILPVSLKFGFSVALFTPGENKTVEAEVTAARANVSGTLHIQSPADLKFHPPASRSAINRQGRGQNEAGVQCHRTGAGSVRQFLGSWRKPAGKSSDGRYEIRYDYIPFESSQSAARLKVIAFDYAIRGKAVGYLPGA